MVLCGAGPISKRQKRNHYSEVQGQAWTWGGGSGLNLVFVNPGVRAIFFKCGPISKRYERNPYSEIQDLAWTWVPGLVPGLIHALNFFGVGEGERNYINPCTT